MYNNRKYIDAFSPPQAAVPLTGSVWGLVLKYSCTGIHQLTDFTILNRRINSTNPASVHNYTDVSGSPVGNVEYYYVLDDGASINVLSQLWVQVIPPANIYAFTEIGLSAEFDSIANSSTNG
jgi:hypothetical protein